MYKINKSLLKINPRSKLWADNLFDISNNKAAAKLQRSVACALLPLQCEKQETFA